MNTEDSGTPEFEENLTCELDVYKQTNSRNTKTYDLMNAYADKIKIVSSKDLVKLDSSDFENYDVCTRDFDKNK